LRMGLGEWFRQTYGNPLEKRKKEHWLKTIALVYDYSLKLYQRLIDSPYQWKTGDLKCHGRSIEGIRYARSP